MRRSLLSRLVDPSPRLRGMLIVLATCGALALFLLGTRDDASRLVPPEPFDKIAHMFVFGGFAALGWLIGGGRFVVLPLAAAMLVGITDEWLQAFTPGRDSDWRDLVADFGGALLAVALLQLLRWRERSGTEGRGGLADGIALAEGRSA